MRIAIIAHGLRVAGGKSVAMNWIEALGRTRNGHTYLLILPAGVGYEESAAPAKGRIVWYRQRWGRIGRAVYDALVLPRVVRAFEPDVIVALGNIGLARPSAPQVLLYHKPQLVYPPERRRGESLANRISNALIRRRVMACLPGTHLVLCQTPVMVRRFRETFGYRGRTALCPNAVSAAVSGVIPDRPALDPWQGLAATTRLFALTRYYAHKNLELILEAFEAFPAQLAGVTCMLTISERDHPRARRLLKRIRARGLGDRVVNVGPLPQAELPRYYLGADALLLPTLLESFSGTYVEAMRFGCPIITSDRDFARTVCRDAALYFDPCSAQSLVAAVGRFRADPRLRERLTLAGRARLGQLDQDWDEIIKRAMQQIEGLVNTGAARDALDPTRPRSETSLR